MEMAADCKSKNRHCWRSMGFFFFKLGGRGEKLIYLGFRQGLGGEERLRGEERERHNSRASTEH